MIVGRGVTLAALATCGFALTGFGASGSSVATDPATALASIPDTAAYRDFVAINDLQALWQSAGLSFPPSAAAVRSPAGREVVGHLADGSQVGTDLWAYAFPDKELLGYDAFAVSQEVAAGEPPHDLSMVWGSIDPSRLQAALASSGVHPVSSGGVIRYTISDPVKLPGLMSAALLGVRNLAVLPGGGRVAVGAADVAPGDVTNLLQDRHPSRSLASDPAVKQVLGLLKGADVMAFGTLLVASPRRMLGHVAERSTVLAFVHKLGVDRLPAAPTFAGYGYLPGSPTHTGALAVAIYPNAKDARTAESILGRDLRSGVSPLRDQPYSQLVTVDTIAVDDNAIVARLTERFPGMIAQSVIQSDFPLFWSPLSKHG